MINRRRFLASLTAALAVPAVLVQRDPIVTCIEFDFRKLAGSGLWEELTSGDGLRKRFPHREFYDVAGQIVFPVYGASGGVSTLAVAYLLAPDWRARRKGLRAVEGDFSNVPKLKI